MEHMPLWHQILSDEGDTTKDNAKARDRCQRKPLSGPQERMEYSEDKRWHTDEASKCPCVTRASCSHACARDEG